MAWIKERVTDDGDKRFVACYRDPEGRQRSAGTYSSRRAAERAANREEAKVREGAWHDHSRGQVTFAEYVETVWLPSKQVETSTLAAYRSYLDKHFIPVFGRRPMGKILPSEVQRWVTTATDERPLRRVGGQVPHHAALGLRTRPGRPGRHLQPLCPHRAAEEGQEEDPHPDPRASTTRSWPRCPPQHRLMVETAINTGLRWGELIALKPRHLDLDHRAAHRRGDHRRGLDQELPHRPADADQALPQGQRTPHHGPPARPGHPARRLTSPTDASGPVTCCSPPATAPRSRGTPSAPGSGDPPSPRPGSTSTSASTTCATPTPPGCSPAAPTSSPSWTAWVMLRSPPPRSTSTPSPTPTPRTSPPSTASATLLPGRHRSPPDKEADRPSPFKRTSKPEWTPQHSGASVRTSPPSRHSGPQRRGCTYRDRAAPPMATGSRRRRRDSFLDHSEEVR